MADNLIIPLDVPQESRSKYKENYLKITKGSGRLMLFAGDQKAEHLNDDFFGQGIDSQDNDPEHLFRIAAKANVGVFAAQLGLIARYGMDYSNVPYLVKLNSKTNLVKTAAGRAQQFAMDRYRPGSQFQGAKRSIHPGGGLYHLSGKRTRGRDAAQAAQLVFQAHQAGLVAVLWIYPRGKAVKDEKDPHLIAGAAGVAATLGSDFVKVNYPRKTGQDSALIFQEAVQAAGRTKVVCAGGESTDPEEFLQRLHDQIHISGAAGNATGRNLHQRPLAEAVRLCNAIYAITVENAGVDEAYKIYRGE